MKKIIIFCLSLIWVTNVNSQITKKSDLLGKWYQCVQSDGKVIKLNAHKCYTEFLNEDKTRLLTEVYEAIDWEFNKLGHYSIKNHFTDDLHKKGSLNFTNEYLKLDGITYYIYKPNYEWSFDRRDGKILSQITLVREDYFNMYKLIDSQVNQLRSLLNDDWMIVPIDSGFSVYYNKGQNIEYEHHFNTNWPNVNVVRHIGDSTITYIEKEPQKQVRQKPFSYYTYNNIEPDSICWFSTVNPVTFYCANNKELREAYFKDGVLKIDVTFQPKWSKDELKIVQNRNNNLRDEMISNGLTHTNESIFYDYRYWVPKNYWQRKSKLYDYWFERLPYESDLVNEYSIFINPNVKCFFCEPLYVDDSDTLFFNRDENYLEAERQRSLRIIALSLGIQDFEIVDSYSGFPVEPK